jgi:hypothetical protein
MCANDIAAGCIVKSYKDLVDDVTLATILPFAPIPPQTDLMVKVCVYVISKFAWYSEEMRRQSVVGHFSRAKVVQKITMILTASDDADEETQEYTNELRMTGGGR